MTAVYSLSMLRTLALHVQGLTTANTIRQDTTRDGMMNLIERMGCVQIDTLQMVHRAQYVTLWSRMGSYNIDDFDGLMYQSNGDLQNHRQLFEYWYHAACLIPFENYRYFIPQMRRFEQKPWPSYKRFLNNGGQEIIDHVVTRISSEGGLRVADFDSKKHQPGSWWNWKPAKRALEYLFNSGHAMIANRINFHRVYDLKERVIPEWVDIQSTTDTDAKRFFIESGVKMLGVCFPNQTSDAFHDIKRTEARPITEELIANGTLVEIEGRLADGNQHTLVVHRDHTPLLEQIADGDVTAERTTFLTPFDNLFWAQKRDQQFWNFNQVLEAYKKPKERIWGYFCLPILHRDELVGRFDVKLHRKEKRLQVKAIYLEPSTELSEPLISGVAEAMGDFMAFHNATDLQIDTSNPAEFGQQLLKVMS